MFAVFEAVFAAANASLAFCEAVSALLLASPAAVCAAVIAFVTSFVPVTLPHPIFTFSPNSTFDPSSFHQI